MRGQQHWICHLDVPTWCQADERLMEELRHVVCVCKRDIVSAVSAVCCNHRPS